MADLGREMNVCVCVCVWDALHISYIAVAAVFVDAFVVYDVAFQSQK